MPESGGNALGVDRLLMLLVGADSIQAIMPFPEERL
jgi:lysyl-tRNA synthetase class II